MTRTSRLLAMLLLGALLAAPAEARRRKKEHDVPPTPTWTDVAPPPAENARGSLWSTASVPWADDLRARRENDVIVVRVAERSVARAKANTKTKRDSKTELGVPHLFGLTEGAASSTLDPSALIEATTKQDFKGDGATTREETFTTTVSGRVVKVLPNGHLYVEAAREMLLNNERQFLLLSGVVRPTDVAADNSVVSTQMADVRIVFAGRGDLSSVQKKNWFLKALSWIVPFL